MTCFFRSSYPDSSIGETLVSEKYYVAKVWLAIWEIFLHENDLTIFLLI